MELVMTIFILWAAAGVCIPFLVSWFETRTGTIFTDSDIFFFLVVSGPIWWIVALILYLNEAFSYYIRSKR